MLAPCSPAGEPTLPQKAQKFIESLGLGDRPDVSPPQGPKVTVLKTGPGPTARKANTTFLRGRHSAGLTTVCPASQSQKAVCSDVIGKHDNII